MSAVNMEKVSMRSIDSKTWKEFQDSGMLWFVNRIIHVFGWSIVLVFNEEQFVGCYPARVSFRGFNADSEEKGYKKVSTFMQSEADTLYAECFGEKKA